MRSFHGWLFTLPLDEWVEGSREYPAVEQKQIQGIPEKWARDAHDL
jgi:hypothetical protein